MSFDVSRLDRIRALFFDLDGTLLQVEMRQFIPTYLDGLAVHLGDRVDPPAFRALARNAIMHLLERRQRDGSNRRQFLRLLETHGGISPQQFERALGAYCDDGLECLRPLVRPLPEIRTLLDTAFASGREVVIATNPVFPREIVAARLRWGGMDDYPFALVSDWENSCLCKPAPGYFEDLLEHFNLRPEQALMIGNDTGHDLAAGRVGIATLLVDTWLIDRKEDALPPDWRGDHHQLIEILQQMV